MDSFQFSWLIIVRFYPRWGSRIGCQIIRKEDVWGHMKADTSNKNVLVLKVAAGFELRSLHQEEIVGQNATQVQMYLKHLEISSRKTYLDRGTLNTDTIPLDYLLRCHKYMRITNTRDSMHWPSFCSFLCPLYGLLGFRYLELTRVYKCHLLDT